VFSLPVPPQPAIITDIVRNPNGSVTLFFLGGPNSTNIVQATANLSPPVTWQNVSTNNADAGGAWQFTESNATNAARFYRSYAPVNHFAKWKFISPGCGSLPGCRGLNGLWVGKYFCGARSLGGNVGLRTAVDREQRQPKQSTAGAFGLQHAATVRSYHHRW